MKPPFSHFSFLVGGERERVRQGFVRKEVDFFLMTGDFYFFFGKERDRGSHRNDI